MKDNDIQILTSEYRKVHIPEGFVELDLGCGKGSFSTTLAERFPERHVLCADIMLGRLRKLNKRAKRMGLENIKLFRTEAGGLINYSLPPASLDRVHILCPDPWPKHKHKGHRLISSEFVSRVTCVLKKKGVFHFSTDDVPYFERACKVLEDSGLFEPRDLSLIDDVIDIKTDFQVLWESEGKKVHHISWMKYD